ncbi:hypothetical protein H7I93_24680 [Mycobacterium nebraskense]|uniref:hypothetical protein n=1 Tax=Mycobacterium nebraskense TaxID=244292 RepID=UPI000A929260|nr:hypothetical protein [Mycobacterium nebraskense]MCV7120306.1 hypothetical protein [Mycobacterium nebraskense]
MDTVAVSGGTVAIRLNRAPPLQTTDICVLESVLVGQPGDPCPNLRKLCGQAFGKRSEIMNWPGGSGCVPR